MSRDYARSEVQELMQQGCPTGFGGPKGKVQGANPRIGRTDPISQSEIHSRIDVPKWSFPAEAVSLAVGRWYESKVSLHTLSHRVELMDSEQATLKQIASMGFPIPAPPRKKRTLKAVGIAVLSLIRAR